MQFQLNGSFKVLAELADGATDAEWVARSFPAANMVGFTVWHCARTIDWAVNCVMRGALELADRAEWQDLRVPNAMFGAGRRWKLRTGKKSKTSMASRVGNSWLAHVRITFACITGKS